MEGLIDLELAAEVERKVYLAFLKGLTQIKFRNQFKKLEQSKKKAATANDDPEDTDIDLEYLYTNLF